MRTAHRDRDPERLESGDQEGLGLLDVMTTLAQAKITVQRQVGWVDGGQVKGYEIHHGRTQAGPLARPYLDAELDRVARQVMASGWVLQGA